MQPTVGDLTQVCSYDGHPGHCCDKVINDLRSALPGGLPFRSLSCRRPSWLRTSVRSSICCSISQPDGAGFVLVDGANKNQLTGIIAPGLKPELYRPGAMSDSNIQAFLHGSQPANDGCGDSARRPKHQRRSNGEEAQTRSRSARFYRQIAAERHDFMFSEKPLEYRHRRADAFQCHVSRRSKKSQLRRPSKTAGADAAFLRRDEQTEFLVPNSSHYVHLDEPDAVVAAIREIITAVRSAARLVPSAGRFSSTLDEN